MDETPIRVPLRLTRNSTVLPTWRCRWVLGGLLPLVMIGLGLPVFAQDAPRQLSLAGAIDLALSEAGNLQVQISDRGVDQTLARSDQARAALLPQLSGAVSQTRRTNSLASVGLTSIGPFQPPRLLGPFSTFDARAEVAQTIFSWSSIQRFRGSRVAVESAEIAGERTRDEIAATVAQLYLRVLADQARIGTAQANRDLAADLLELARNQKAAGTGLAIEVTRAQFKLSQEEQAVLVARRTLRTSLLQLNRGIGLPLETPLALSDVLERPDGDVPDVAESWSRALASRADLAAQLKKLDALEKDYSATRAERIPSVAGFADYGTLGTGPAYAIPTWAVGVRVDLPIFDGGGMEARRAESRARLEEERLRTEDLRREIRLEVETALEAIQIARGEMSVVDAGIGQSNLELEQAQRRYRAGVTTSLEVTEAQANIKAAEEARIGALYRFNVARIQLADATGVLRNSSRP